MSSFDYSPDYFRPMPDTIVYPSRTGGESHTVVIHLTRRAGGAFSIGQRYVTCDCKAGRYHSFIGRRALKGCWAMIAARRIANIPAISDAGYSAGVR